MTDLSALIVALEGATEATRELDESIALVAGYRRKDAGKNFAGHQDYVWAEPGELFSYGTRPPRYTSSIDAALTLVPEGWKIANLGQDDYGLWWCEMRKPYITSFSKHGVVLCPMKRPTASLALAITALKARQASSTPSDQSPAEKE